MVKHHSGEKWIVVCLRALTGTTALHNIHYGTDEGTLSDILKSADDTKMFGKAGTRESVNTFWADLQVLLNNYWSEKWQMKLNT